LLPNLKSLKLYTKISLNEAALPNGGLQIYKIIISRLIVVVKRRVAFREKEPLKFVLRGSWSSFAHARMTNSERVFIQVLSYAYNSSILEGRVYLFCEKHVERVPPLNGRAPRSFTE
jgi:hypothetical protein